MSLHESIYSDVVKDVIGDDPVLDQFDIFYAASFYNTMTDDYITGTMLNVSKIGNTKTFSISSRPRGRFFSKYYANSQPALPTDTQTLSVYPMLSTRLVPWSSKVSRTAYRLNQSFSDGERYYDSCTPDFSECVSNEGVKVWSISNRENAFSPYSSVTTSSVGYMLFDSIEVDRQDEGYYEKDPTVFNGWTRSFPFESRYSTVKRLIAIDSTLGMNVSKLTIDWQFPKLDDMSTADADGTFGGGPVFPAATKVYDASIPCMTKDDIFLNNLQKTSANPISKFIPIVPGLLKGQKNALRQKTYVDGNYGEVAIPMGEYADRKLDSATGYSLLFPTDIDLSTTGPCYLTSSMGGKDLIKFLFGFGDLNNITYGRRTFDVTKKKLSYNESFEDYALGTLAYNIPNYNNNEFNLRWSYLGSRLFENPWQVAGAEGEVSFSFLNKDSYYFISGVGSVSTTTGIRWSSASGSLDEKVLISATSAGYITSSMLLTVTSSYPWAFSYDRAICGNNDESLQMDIIGIPGDTGDDETFDFLGMGGYPYFFGADVLTGSGEPQSEMETFDYMTNGFAQYPDNKNYPLPPGCWRIRWTHTTSPTTPHSPTSFSAINNFKFYTFSDLEKSSMIGSNNLPEFAAKKVDDRIDPTFKSTVNNDGAWSAVPSIGDLHVTGTSNMYGSYVFGVSPEIRGWKYGLYNGYPTFSKAIFRRDKFGQFRDMLEQRQYSKFVNVMSDIGQQITNPVDEDYQGKNNKIENLGPSVVEVNFVKQRYRKNDKGIGYIYNEKVDPSLTYSQNLSIEVTSSLPYFDDEAKLRQESELRLITDATLTSLQFNASGLTVT